MLIFCSLLIAFGATAQSKLGSQTPKKSIFITSILLVLMTLVSCSVGYKNDGKEVTWNTWNEGTGYTSSHVDADPKTFEILNDDYGRDKKHAFYEGDIINGADGGLDHASRFLRWCSRYASSEPMKTVKSESAISTVCTHVPCRFCAPRKQ